MRVWQLYIRFERKVIITRIWCNGNSNELNVVVADIMTRLLASAS